jgi:hypothetical protein
VKEQIELPRKCAFRPEGSFGYRFDFAMKIREPGQDQARIRIPDAPEQNAIQQFGHVLI